MAVWAALGLGAAYILILAFVYYPAVWFVLPVYAAVLVGALLIYSRQLPASREEAQDVAVDALPTEDVAQRLPVVCIAYVDDFETVLEKVSEQAQTALIAEVNRCVAEMAKQIEGMYRRYERDKYILIFERRYLAKLEKERFGILEKVRAIKSDTPLPLSISLAIGVGDTAAASNALAMQAMEMALGRGGDQVVIKNADNSYVFYGGSTQSGIRRSAVRARLASHALRKLMEQSSNVVICGHAVPDMDSIGAAFGIHNMANSLQKPSAIVLDATQLVIPLIERMEQEMGRSRDGKLGPFISPEQVSVRVQSGTLLVMLDTQLTSNTACPEIFEGRTSQVVIIDHHRRGTHSLEDAAMYCVEPGASSTCELVSEMAQYFGQGIKLPRLDAEAMLAGIYLDTKSFNINTNSRTFEAAAYLRRQGADTIKARDFLSDDMNTFIRRSELVRQAVLLQKGLAYVVLDDLSPDAQLIASQAADVLAGLRGIRAAFVLYYQGTDILISARSLGAVNIQLVMEALGGGGHLYMAGAKLKGVTVSQAIEQLLGAAMAYA